MLGNNRELALYRAAYLGERGIEVVAPASRAETLGILQRGGFDAVIISYTLSSDSVLEYIELVRQICPGCPIVVISKTGNLDPKVMPDEIVMADHGPRALMEALRRLTNKSVH